MFRVRCGSPGTRADRFGVLWALVVWGMICGLAARPPLRAAELAAVSFGLERPAVTLHEPVVLDFTVENRLAEPVTLDLGYDRQNNFQVSITGPGGATVQLPGVPRGGLSRTAKFALQQGATYTQSLLLNQRYQFEAPGVYRIQVTLTAPIRSQSGETETVSPSQLVLAVRPRDPTRLAEVCSDLTKTALSPSAGPAFDAAKALSYVNDLVAVPFLARLAREGPFVVVFRSVALQGLGRIAHADGLPAVLSRLGPADRALGPAISAMTPSPPMD